MNFDFEAYEKKCIADDKRRMRIATGTEYHLVFFRWLLKVFACAAAGILVGSLFGTVAGFIAAFAMGGIIGFAKVEYADTKEVEQEEKR